MSLRLGRSLAILALFLALAAFGCTWLSARLGAMELPALAGITLAFGLLLLDIIIHEGGHAIAAKISGAGYVEVILGMSSATSTQYAVSPQRTALVALAGPVLEACYGGLLLLLAHTAWGVTWIVGVIVLVQAVLNLVPYGFQGHRSDGYLVIQNLRRTRRQHLAA